MIKHFAMLAAISAMAFANTAAADQDDNPDWSKQQQGAGSSGLGESCRRRTDCKEGLKCVRRVCTDPHEGETCGATADCGGGELKCISDKCTNPNAPAGATSRPATPDNGGSDGGDNGNAKPATATPAAPGDWIKFRLDDGQTHPFIGITGLLGGFGIAGQDLGVGAGLNFGAVAGASLFALKAGIIVGGHHELAAEITPFFTAFPTGGGAVFETNVSYGYLIPITDHLSWPIRIGAGIMAGPSPNAGDNAFFEVRADLIGVQVNVGHLLIDLHLPSFRYFVTSANGVTDHSLNWLFGISLGYAL